MMKNKKFSIIMLCFMIMILLPIIVFIINNSGGSMVDKFYNAYNSQARTVIYMGRPTCSYCTKFKPVLDNVKKEYGVDYVYINTDRLTRQELEQILKTLNMNISNFSTPYTVIAENGDIVDDITGYVDRETLVSTFKKLELIKK